MLKRKLAALSFKDQLNIDDQAERRKFIGWLEDQKIRLMGIEQRAGLRKVDAEDYPFHLKAYLKQLECPLDDSASETSILAWLMDYAIQLEYMDNASKYSGKSSEELKSARSNTKPKSENPLENLDLTSAEFKEGINSIANSLGIAQHPDPTVTLKAVNVLVQDRLSVQRVNEILKTSSEEPEHKPYPLEQFPLGLDSGDPVVDNAGRILRLLYVKRMRDLQTDINQTIVKCQSITANPKTDQKLGQVGRM